MISSHRFKGSQVKKILTMSVAAMFLLPATQAGASQFIVGKKFSNCTALNLVYPGGVAKSKLLKNKGGATKKTPIVSAKVYAENSSKDRDGDGIACEK